MTKLPLCEVPEQSAHPNPLVRAYGHGPAGKRCKHCRLCYGKSFANNYYKCQLRGDTNGPGTDHRINWDACGKFEEREP